MKCISDHVGCLLILTLSDFGPPVDNTVCVLSILRIRKININLAIHSTEYANKQWLWSQLCCLHRQIWAIDWNLQLNAFILERLVANWSMIKTQRMPGLAIIPTGPGLLLSFKYVVSIYFNQAKGFPRYVQAWTLQIPGNLWKAGLISYLTRPAFMYTGNTWSLIAPTPIF